MDKREWLYNLLKKVPKGKVTTYKALADKCKISPREAGYILSKNPHAPQVPCHRVVRSNGEVGGYTYKGRIDSKRKETILRKEGVEIQKGRVGQEFLIK